MAMYRDIILDHYKHPRNFGTLTDPSVKASEYNATCGDRITMEMKFRVQSTEYRVQEVRFSGEGCAISVASASMLTEQVKGMKKDEILKLVASDILKMLGTELTPSRTKCAVLPLEVLQKAVLCLKP